MKILLVSDVESNYLWNHFQADKFKDIDLIISCGDLKSEYLSFLVTMIKAPLFYIHGNHDGSYIKNPPEGCQSIDDSLIIYKGFRILALGGSKRYNEGPFQYTEKEMKRRILKLTPKLMWYKGFDILVSHSGGFRLGDDSDPCHEGFKSFIELIDKYSPKYFIHGHCHLNYGLKPRIMQYKNTTVINGYERHILDYQL